MALVIALLCLAYPTSAQAKCGRSSPGLTPATGSILAPGSTTYVFVGTYSADARIVVTAGKQEIDAEILEIASNRSLRVFSVRPTERLESYTVYVLESQYSQVAATYFVSDDAPSHSSKAVHLSSPEHKTSDFICSPADYHVARASVVAPAYRVEWASSLRDYLVGNRKAMVVPTDTGVFLGKALAEGSITFGDRSCIPSVLPKISGTLFVGVATMASDGRYEMPLSPRKFRLGSNTKVKKSLTTRAAPATSHLPKRKKSAPAFNRALAKELAKTFTWQDEPAPKVGHQIKEVILGKRWPVWRRKRERPDDTLMNSSARQFGCLRIEAIQQQPKLHRVSA